MGQKRRPKFINKNDPSTFTFRVISAAHDDPNSTVTQDNAVGVDGFDLDDDALCHVTERRRGGEQQIVQNRLKREVPKNALKKGRFKDRLPSDLLKVLDGKDFGVHENLSKEHTRILCREIYGTDSVPDEYRRDKIGSEVTKETDRVDHESSHAVDEEVLESAFCYFPPDGYDYEKHLRPIQGTGRFIPTTKSKETEIRKQPNEFSDKNNLTSEEREALEALDRAEEYEELADDFIVAAGGATLLDESPTDILWGGFVPQLPDLSHLEAMRREHAALLETERKELEVGDGRCDDDLAALLAEEYDDSDDAQSDESDGNLVDPEDVENFEDLLDEFIAHRNEQLVRPKNQAHNKDHNKDVNKDDNEDDDKDDDDAGSDGDVNEGDVELVHFQDLNNLSQEEVKQILELVQEEDEQDTNNDDEDVNYNGVNCPDGEFDKRQWDCETVLSNRSNLYNRPGRVNCPLDSSSRSGGSVKLVGSTFNAILRAKTVKSVMQSVNLNDQPQQQESKALQKIEEEEKDESDDDQADKFVNIPDVITKRPKNETNEEKKARKHAAKTARRLIRECKKQNAAVVKEETKKRLKVVQSINPFDIQRGVRQFHL